MDQAVGMARYAQYIKPFFAPPDWIFGPVWSLLYITIIIGFIWILSEVRKKKLPKMLAGLILVNGLSNILFTPIQFGLNNLWLAWVDIVIVLVSLAWIEKELWGKNRKIFWLLLPYLLWVSFATILQTSITILNA